MAKHKIPGRPRRVTDNKKANQLVIREKMINEKKHVGTQKIKSYKELKLK